jgi:Cysteine-rich secretory protein family
MGAPPLVWSDELAEVAQDWANRLIATGGLGNRPNNRYGENIYTITGGHATPSEVVALWAKEAGDTICAVIRAPVLAATTRRLWRARLAGCAVADAPRRCGHSLPR